MPSLQFMDWGAPSLKLLLEGADCAEALGTAIWEMAVEIDRLLSAGMTATQLRWLVHKGFLEHRFERAAPRARGREFQAAGAALRFTSDSCFVLTAAGIRQLRRKVETSSGVIGDDQFAKQPNVGELAGGRLVPTWNLASRELLLAGVVVKRFRQPAGNQEAILNAFQEEHWPERIDDPLAPVAEHDSKRRLHETIQRLNRCQKNRLVRFSGDGTGCGVQWRALECLGESALGGSRRQQ